MQYNNTMNLEHVYNIAIQCIVFNAEIEIMYLLFIYINISNKHSFAQQT